VPAERSVAKDGSIAALNAASDKISYRIRDLHLEMMRQPIEERRANWKHYYDRLAALMQLQDLVKMRLEERGETCQEQGERGGLYPIHHDAGPLCIECKNYREWVYPHDKLISELIVKAADLNAIPVLIARRIHYTTRTNLLEPAGIIAHETYYTLTL